MTSASVDFVEDLARRLDGTAAADPDDIDRMIERIMKGGDPVAGGREVAAMLFLHGRRSVDGMAQDFEELLETIEAELPQFREGFEAFVGPLVVAAKAEMERLVAATPPKMDSTQ